MQQSDALSFAALRSVANGRFCCRSQLQTCLVSDSVAVMRFATGADYDGAAMPRSGAVFLEPISKSFEEDDEAGKLDKAEEIVGVVLPANEDPALPLKPGEEALDEPASHVAA